MTAAEVVEDVEMKEEKVRTNIKLPGFLNFYFPAIFSAATLF